MNRRNQNPTDMFKKQDATVYLTNIKILKSTTFSTSHSRSHF